MQPIKIIDVIDHRNKYGKQRMLVIDRMPQCLFERKGRLLIGHDSGFFRFYRYDSPSPGFVAFAGRKFEIPMVDGSVIEASGQWWDVSAEDYRGLTYDLGIATVEDLAECHVFTGCYHVDRELVDAWIAEHEPSNNYHKYDPLHRDFGKQTIDSPWETRHSLA